MTCRKATGVAKAMKEKFGDQLVLRIYTTDSKEAADYPLKGATNLFVNQEWVSLDVATSGEKMEEYLSSIFGETA